MDNERKDFKTHLKETYLKEFNKTTNRVNWFMCKVMETTARKKSDLIADIEITGKQTLTCNAPKTLRHMMQFMSYIGMNEKELS